MRVEGQESDRALPSKAHVVLVVVLLGRSLLLDDHRLGRGCENKQEQKTVSRGCNGRCDACSGVESHALTLSIVALLRRWWVAGLAIAGLGSPVLLRGVARLVGCSLAVGRLAIGGLGLLGVLRRLRSVVALILRHW